jgi:hypothetical protein
MPRRIAFSVLSILVVAGLCACTSGPVAEVSARDAVVTLASGDNKPAVLEKKGSAQKGDVVETDAKGQAQVVFADGSLARLGASTKLTVTELSTAELQRSAMTLDVGETWHRVQKLVAEDPLYAVKTPVGVASVKGTAFGVTCTPEKVCTITVVEGIVEFTTKDGTVVTIEPFQRLVVPAADGGTPAATALPIDAMLTDPWLSANIDEDSVPLDAPSSSASLAGDWKLEVTVVSTDGRQGYAVGDVEKRDWNLAPTECDGATCTTTMTSSSGNSWPLTYDGEDLVFSDTSTVSCVNLDNPEEIRDPDGFDDTFTWRLKVTETKVIDGVPTATKIEGEESEHLKLRADVDPICDAAYTTADTTWSVSLVRA